MNQLIVESLDFITRNAAGLAILGTAMAGVFKFWQFVSLKKEEARNKQFENYHDLIDRFNTDRQKNGGAPFLDAQVAIAYELRNFPEYFDVTKRILMDRRLDLEEDIRDKPDHIYKRLIEEMKRTESYIDKSFLKRFFNY